MRSRYTLIAVIILTGALLFYVLYPTDENRIRKTISKAEEAVMSKDLDGLMGFISYNYLDDRNNSYLWLRTYFQRAFDQLHDIEIERDIIAITIDDALAEAELAVRVLASRGDEKGYILGDAANARNIRVFFEKISNEWLVTGTEGVFRRDSPAERR